MRRIALVHDQFARMKEAEKVAEALYQILPGAQLFTTLAVPEQLSPRLQHADMKTTWMRYLPKPERYFRHYFMLYPFAVESLDLRAYDLIVSNCAGYAKGVRKNPDAIHICYCHAPMRWIWQYPEYSARLETTAIGRLMLPALLKGVGRWDLRAAQRPDYYIAPSPAVARRIKEIYRRESVVIPPPIEVARFEPGEAEEDLFLMLAGPDGLNVHDRVELAIEACNLLQKRLVIIGDGPDRERLQSVAGPTVKFFGWQPHSVVAQYARKCTALIYTAGRDYARAPIEVNAAGRPVLVERGNGVADFVVEGRTGLFFEESTVQSLAQAIIDCERWSWNSQLIRRHAEHFDRKVFNSRIAQFLRQVTPWLWKPGSEGTADSLTVKAA